MPDQHSRTYNKLRLKDFKLSTLLDITKAINNNLSTDKLFDIFEFIIRDQLGIGKLILFNYNGKKWSCALRFGAKRSVKQFDVEKDLLHIKEITVIESSSKEHLSSFDVVIPVYHKSRPLAYLLLGDIDEDEIKISPIIKHMPFIQTLTNILMVAIENKRLARENIRQERMKKEMELASEMQNMLFPSKLPDNEHFQIAAYYQPHQDVGGDYYDFIELNDKEIMFCLADVSGKGVSAALLAANFQANLRAIATREPSLTKAVTELNTKVMDSAQGEKFITLFIAKYNLRTRELKYINAGHNPPLLKGKNSIQQLSEGCTGLGMFSEIPNIKMGKLTVPKDAVFLGFTDGVVEIENSQAVAFGSENLISMLDAHNSLTMSELNQTIITAVNAHRGSQPYIDDIALFSCKFC